MTNATRGSRRTAAACLALLSLLFSLSLAGEAATGTWTRKGYAIAGIWSIVERDGKWFVVLDERFRTKKAPDLNVFLSPTALDELNNRNATEGSVFVGALEGSEGRQELEIPAGTDLEGLRTILIHCQKYSKLWGGASLR